MKNNEEIIKSFGKLYVESIDHEISKVIPTVDDLNGATFYDGGPGNYHFYPLDEQYYCIADEIYNQILEIKSTINHEKEYLKASYPGERVAINIVIPKMKDERKYVQSFQKGYTILRVSIGVMRYELLLIKFFITDDKVVNCILKELQYEAYNKENKIKSCEIYPSLKQIKIGHDGISHYYNSKCTYNSNVGDIVNDFLTFIHKNQTAIKKMTT